MEWFITTDSDYLLVYRESNRAFHIHFGFRALISEGSCSANAFLFVIVSDVSFELLRSLLILAYFITINRLLRLLVDAFAMSNR